MKKIPIVLDTDPGIDDAAAIAAILHSPDLDLQLITTVAGNVSIEKTTHNALQLMDFWDKSIPVARGASLPLTRLLRDAALIHGESGMSGYHFTIEKSKEIQKPAYQAIFDLLNASEEKLTLLAIGPLTNIAILFTQYPKIKEKVLQIVLMGGSAVRGNFTPSAEFNIGVDPEAASRVFASGVKILMCGLDVTNKALLTPEYLLTLKKLGRSGEMLHAIFSHYRSGSMTTGMRMHDLCAVAALVRPEIFTWHSCFVAVETQGEWTSGNTIVDIDGQLDKPNNAQVALDIDVNAFQHWVAEVLAFMP